MVIIVAPAFAAETATPPDNYVSVAQGGLFLLRGSITFDDPNNPGEFVWGPVGWYHDGNADENFCLENTPSVYWSDLTPVENVSITEAEYATSHVIDIRDNGDKISRDGTFYIDIWLRAKSCTGVLHKAENQWISFAMDYITLFEPGMTLVNAPPIYVDVFAAGVTVDISPASQSGWAGEDLTYTVTVTNTGASADNYTLTVTDDLGWTMSIVPSSFTNVPASGVRTATLSVTVGSCGGCTDNIKVTADGVYAENSDNCTATQSKGPRVDVEITPDYQSELPGSTLTYTVTITNTGTENDNYDITISETQPWGSHFSPVTVKIYPIDDAHTSNDPWTYEGMGPINGDMMYPLRWEEEPYTPWMSIGWIKYDLENIPAGATITGAKIYFYGMCYTYGMCNTLNVGGASDDSWTEETITWDTNPELGPIIGEFGPGDGWGWGDVTSYIASEFAGDGVATLWLYPKYNMVIAPLFTKERGSYRPEQMPYLQVTYEPPPVPPTVTTKDATGVTKNQATLNADFTVGGYASVNVWFQYRVQGETTWIETTPTTYTASGSHSDVVTGLSYETTYEFRAALQYGKTIYGDNLIFKTSTCYTPPPIQPGQSITKTLTVPIPLDAVPCTTNYITVTATSQCDPTVSDSDTCQAHAKAALKVNVLPIVPNWQENCPGKPIQYCVTIVNEGAAADNYDVVLSDTMGWDLSDDIQVEIENGENTTVCFQVIVPADAIPSTLDVITVTATSKTDNTVTDSETCTAHAKELGIVDVEITPENQEAHCTTVKELIDPCYRYDPVTFKVAVTNLGQLDDKYELTVVDRLGWGLKLTPQELFVPAGDTEYAALSVTVPEDVWGCTWDDIIVTAVGKLATFKQDPLNATDSDTCRVHADICKGVEIELLPDNVEPQTGTPCSTLTWLVVVKNTGNVPDNFCLTVDQLVYDCAQESLRTYGDWDYWIEGDNCFSLDPCTKATALLHVNIPCDARTSIWDNITVTVLNVSQPEEKISDTYKVRAHVLEPGPRIPEGVIEIAVEAEVVAIDIWPISYDFGVMDEHKQNWTDNDYFTIRNVGNVKENIFVRGTDAQSMPGEPVTSWELSDKAEGIDQYMLACVGPNVVGGELWLEETPELLFASSLCPGCERTFGIWIKTPSVITTPARMWARVKITAIAAMTYGIPKS